MPDVLRQASVYQYVKCCVECVRDNGRKVLLPASLLSSKTNTGVNC